MSQKDFAIDNVNELEKKIKLDFYRLHYPQKKPTKSLNKGIRSKSVVSVIQSNLNEEQ